MQAKHLLLWAAIVAASSAGPGCSCASTTQNGNNDLSGDLAGADLLGVNQDQGVNACGNQDPTCTVKCTGQTCATPTVLPVPSDGTDPTVKTDGTGRDPTTGYIVLNQSSATFDFLWIADDREWAVGLVSKVSTKPRATPYPNGQNYGEVARYLSVTCFSDPVNGGKEGIQPGQTDPGTTLCADGVHGCCARDHDVTTPASASISLAHNHPSRTAVDFNGDVWVANRAFNRQGSVTKIANTITDCIDRNGNGKIDTSSDTNGDGIIQTDCNNDNIMDDLSTACTDGRAPEFLGLDDECILFTTNVGGPTVGYIRPLTLGPGTMPFDPSDAWPGSFATGQFWRVDGKDGHIKQTVQIATVSSVVAQPYGATIDQDGFLWAPNEGQTNLFVFDTNTPTTQGLAQATSVGGTGFYGIALDGYKTGGILTQQIWLGQVGSSGAYRYRPIRNSGISGLTGGTWARVNFNGGPSQGRGIAVDNRSPTSYAWVALDGLASGTQGGIGRIPIDTPDGPPDTTTGQNYLTTFWSTNQGGTLGAGVAVDLDIWGINQTDSSATHFSVDPTGTVTAPGAADKVNLNDKGADGFCPLSGADTYQTGCLPYPYTYSDFTGFGLRNFTSPRGFYQDTITGCGPGKTVWISVVWDAITPPGTTISVRVRSADDTTSLMSAPWTGNYPTSPADLSMAPGPVLPNPSGFLQVEFDFTTTDKNVTPALKSYQIVSDCPQITG
jgi:hypothetical protein